MQSKVAVKTFAGLLLLCRHELLTTQPPISWGQLFGVRSWCPHSTRRPGCPCCGPSRCWETEFGRGDFPEVYWPSGTRSASTCACCTRLRTLKFSALHFPPKGALSSQSSGINSGGASGERKCPAIHVKEDENEPVHSKAAESILRASVPNGRISRSGTHRA